MESHRLQRTDWCSRRAVHLSPCPVYKDPPEDSPPAFTVSSSFYIQFAANKKHFRRLFHKHSLLFFFHFKYAKKKSSNKTESRSRKENNRFKNSSFLCLQKWHRRLPRLVSAPSAHVSAFLRASHQGRGGSSRRMRLHLALHSSLFQNCRTFPLMFL